MFCVKTHNMGFVSPTDNKTPIVPLQGAALRAKGVALNPAFAGGKKGTCACPFLIPACDRITTLVIR